MAAWGPDSFQNDLSTEYAGWLAQVAVCPILIEKIDVSDTSFVKHKYAYYIDRFRAAVELMCWIETSTSFNFSKGYWQLALEKLKSCATNQEWLDCWSNLNSKKRSNYINSVLKQCELVEKLMNEAND